MKIMVGYLRNRVVYFFSNSIINSNVTATCPDQNRNIHLITSNLVLDRSSFKGGKLAYCQDSLSILFSIYVNNDPAVFSSNFGYKQMI